MPMRNNDQYVQSRAEPFAWRGAYDASSNLEYEGWAEPGASESGSSWLICKYTYDASNNLTHTKWAQTTPYPPASYNQVWSNYLALTYV